MRGGSSNFAWETVKGLATKCGLGVGLCSMGVAGVLLREARVRTQASLESYSSCPRSCTNPLPAGTKCAVVDEVTLDCGTARCRLTRPVEGWVNRADLVPLEGDVFVVG